MCSHSGSHVSVLAGQFACESGVSGVEGLNVCLVPVISASIYTTTCNDQATYRAA